MSESKACKYCNIVKQLNEFPSDARLNDGHKNICRNCFKDKYYNPLPKLCNCGCNKLTGGSDYCQGHNPNSHKRTPQSNKKTSETLMKKHQEKEWGFISGCIPHNKGKSHLPGIPRHDYDDEFRKKISDDVKCRGDEWKQKLRQIQIQRIKSGLVPTENTHQELKMEEMFKEHNIRYEKQWAYELGIADFYLLDLNIIFEIDGEYWHNLPGRKERDEMHTEYLENCGYKVIRVSDIDVDNDSDKIIKMIMEK